MKEQIEDVIQYLKDSNIRGCITGSSLLGEYWEGMDVDLFVYDEKAFTKILWNLYYNPIFIITDKLENWKFEQYVDRVYDTFYKAGLVTIKFMYNTCIPVNIILKKNCNNIFSVLSTFDMDIITIGYDIETKQVLDLSGNSKITRKVSWNKWNTNFYNPELWQISRILRQLERVFKYHNRKFDTDEMIFIYIKLIDKIQEYQNIFNSNNFSEKLKIKKNNTKIVKQLCEVWLETHTITDEQIELLKEKIKEI